MTLDGFITFLGLIAAALAIVSPVTRLQLSMARTTLILWSTIFTLSVLYFEFFDLMAMPCPKWTSLYCPTLSKDGPVTPQQAAFLVVFLWLGVLAYAWLRPRPKVGSLPALRSLIDRFAETGRYGDIVDLANDSVGLADDCAAGELPYQVRRARLTGAKQRPPLDPVLIGLEEEQPRDRPPLFSELRNKTGRAFARLLPSDEKMREAADGILQTLLSRRAFVDWVAEHRPRFGARLLGLRSYKVGDYSTRLLGWLISHPGSALYDEIRSNQNLDRCGYVIPERNWFLHALLSDARVAENLEAYQPIGEHMIAVLRVDNAPDYVETLNRAFDHHWDDEGRWRDPVFVGLRFFDIMVQAAACQNVPWHMWLFYTHHVVERLEEIYEDEAGSEVFGEYPTRAARLLYIAMDNLADWIALAAVVDPQGHHHTPKLATLVHENDNIPKSAALAVGICMRKVVLSDRLGEPFKSTLLEVAIRPLRDSRMRKGHDILRAVLVKSIVEGGILSGGPDYLARLRHLYAEIDKPWHNDVEDFREALEAARA
ncbi:hypothetical protein [Sphingobium sp. KCTC 72723]|jgi:hypothetical protein|uniref:hypothetical protein n=1 Tax=Sphingobium sp. KCTC 72723 TaxID=2733867 RepID=UPI00165DBEF1|nr:hypothetical protein [Sphingobium sp. KCTC 72723]